MFFCFLTEGIVHFLTLKLEYHHVRKSLYFVDVGYSRPNPKLYGPGVALFIVDDSKLYTSFVDLVMSLRRVHLAVCLC